jgi:hypothetical protein
MGFSGKQASGIKLRFKISGLSKQNGKYNGFTFPFIKIANVGREFDPLVDTINASVKPHKK